MGKVKTWINNHQYEFEKTIKDSKKININWDQEQKIINSFWKENQK